MVIGTYRMTDVNMNEIAPASSIIKNGHPITDETTPCTMASSEPQGTRSLPFSGKSKYRTPAMEDYALGLRISRDYQIGRVC